MSYIEYHTSTKEQVFRKQAYKRKQPSKMVAVRLLKIEHHITVLEKEIANLKRQLEEQAKNISMTIHIQNTPIEEFLKTESFHQRMRQLLGQKKQSRYQS